MTKAKPMTRVGISCLAIAAMFAASAQANVINTLIHNFDVEYDGTTGQLFDLERPEGGNLSGVEGRTVSAFDIEVDGNIEVSKTNPPDAIIGDLLVNNLGGNLTINELVNDIGGNDDPLAFGFDLWIPGGSRLRVGIDDISYTLVPTPIPGLSVFSFFAEGKVYDQDLPNDLAYSEDVIISYTATNVDLETVTVGQGVTAEDLVVGLQASGVMTITGTMGTAVPEPLTGVLALIAGAAVFSYRLFI